MSKFYWHIIIVTDMQTDLLLNPALHMYMQGSYLQGYIVHSVRYKRNIVKVDGV